MSVHIALQDRWLDLNDVLRELVAQGFISQDSAEHALNARRRNATHGQMHPLEFIASQQLGDLSRPGKLLDLESLTLSLSRQAGQPYLRIDPLKINVAAVTPLMSYAFAQRHKILAVAIDRDAVTDLARRKNSTRKRWMSTGVAPTRVIGNLSTWVRSASQPLT